MLGSAWLSVETGVNQYVQFPPPGFAGSHGAVVLPY